MSSAIDGDRCSSPALTSRAVVNILVDRVNHREPYALGSAISRRATITCAI